MNIVGLEERLRLDPVLSKAVNDFNSAAARQPLTATRASSSVFFQLAVAQLGADWVKAALHIPNETAFTDLNMGGRLLADEHARLILQELAGRLFETRL